MIRTFLFLSVVSILVAQSNGSALGEIGVSVVADYRTGDATSFRDIAHPELAAKIRRLMLARVDTSESFAPASARNRESISKLRDSELVDAFVKFVSLLNKFPPHISAKWSHSLGDVRIEGLHATVTVIERLEAMGSKDGKLMSSTSNRTVEFQLENGRWLYVSGPATNLHLDLPLGIVE